MKYTLGEKKDGKITIEFTLDAKEWENEIENAYQKNKGKYKKEGFRQGKVPRKVLENTCKNLFHSTNRLNYISSHSAGFCCDCANPDSTANSITSAVGC